MAPLPKSSLATTATPKAPIARKTAIRRTHAAAGLNDEHDSENPSKRQKHDGAVASKKKVEFDPYVQSRIMDDSIYEKDTEAVRLEVRSVIQAHLRGDSEGYDIVKEVFSTRPSDPDAPSAVSLRTHLVAMTGCVSLLNRNCSGLVKAVLDCEWLGRDESFVKLYVQFLGNLASAQGSYVGLILGMLVDKFGGVRPATGRLPDYPYVTKEQLTERTHMALRYLLRLIPSASGTLAPILSSKFPFSDDTKKVLITYIHNLIAVTEYAPELKSDIFALITERLVNIDVQMQVDLDDLDDELASAIVGGISVQAPKEILDEEEDDDSDADSVVSDESDDDTTRIKELQGNVEKMDAILDILFSLYSAQFKDPHSIEADTVFSMLMEHFSSIILPTYRSRHTQFLLFHFAQQSEELVDAFTGLCATYAFDSARPAVLRQSSAAYLASFIARGNHVSTPVVRTMFEYIVKHLEEIRMNNELTCRGPDLRKYGIFYAMTQALLYIFCFRWRDLVDNPEIIDEDDPAAFSGTDLIWGEGIKEAFSRTIYSKLNPLKVCSPPIVEQFAQIARHLDFLYVYPLLESNKRIRLSQFLGSNGASGAADYRRDTGYGNGIGKGSGNGAEAGEEESWFQLDAYFPFDPYQLPLSKKWLEGDYVQWRGVPGLEVDADSSEDESDGGVELGYDEDFDEDDESPSDDE